MHCPNCGNPLREGDRYCNHCGAPVEPPKGVQCPRCGSFAQPGDSCCGVCGYPLGNAGYAGPGPGYEGPNPYGYNNAAPYQGPRPCSRFLAGLLAILLGSLGVHNFYLGYTQRGVFQLLLTTVFAFLTCGVSAVVAQVWAIVEAVLLFSGNIWCDARGIPLRD